MIFLPGVLPWERGRRLAGSVAVGCLNPQVLCPLDPAAPLVLELHLPPPQSPPPWGYPPRSTVPGQTPKKRAQPISTHRFSQVRPLGNASWVFTLKMPSLWEVFCHSRSWAQISPGYRHTLPPALRSVASRI